MTHFVRICIISLIVSMSAATFLSFSLRLSSMVTITVKTPVATAIGSSFISLVQEILLWDMLGYSAMFETSRVLLAVTFARGYFEPTRRVWQRYPVRKRSGLFILLTFHERMDVCELIQRIKQLFGWSEQVSCRLLDRV
jgi:hypothetical protein